MKINFLKYVILFVFSAFAFVSCYEDDGIVLTPQEQTFTLNDPGVNRVVLDYAYPTNPAFMVSWNNATASGDYTFEMSPNESFAPAVSLGTTSTTSFSLTTSEFNTLLLANGAVPHNEFVVYFRASNSGGMSNVIRMIFVPYAMDNPVITQPSSGATFPLDESAPNDNALTVTWSDFDNASEIVDVVYTVEFAAAGTNFADAMASLPLTNEYQKIWSNNALNRIALDLGIEPETTGSLDIRVKSVINNGNGIGAEILRYSEPVTISVTTYSTVLDLSSPWGVVGSATPNSWDGPDIPFYTTATDGVLVAYANLIVGEIKFRQNNDWALNYGDNGFDGTLEENGSNIPISTAGSYKITFDTNNLTYTLETFSVGIVGSATPNSWDGPDVMMTYDPYSDSFRAITTLVDGEMKFRMNNAWDVNYGDDGADGTLEAGSANIPVSAGNYIISVNLTEMTYTVEAIDNIWGLVGSATPNSWDGPDVEMTRDWSQPNDDIWIATGVTLVDGEMKFRANNAWDVNYGDDGADGTIEAGGANINVSAGTYNVTLNLTNNTYMIQ